MSDRGGLFEAIFDLPLKFLAVFIILFIIAVICIAGLLMMKAADYAQTIALGDLKEQAPATNAIRTMSPMIVGALLVLPPILLFLIIAYKKRL